MLNMNKEEIKQEQNKGLIARVFKIHKKNLHEIGKVLVCLKQLIFNIKNSKTAV